MDLQTELKRLERLKTYLELIQRCDYAIEISKERIEHFIKYEDVFGNCYYYASRIEKKTEYKKWLENRYQLALNN